MAADARGFVSRSLFEGALGKPRSKDHIAPSLIPCGRRTIVVDPSFSRKGDGGVAELAAKMAAGVENSAFGLIALKGEGENCAAVMVGFEGGEEGTVDMHNDRVSLGPGVQG